MNTKVLLSQVDAAIVAATMAGSEIMAVYQDPFAVANKPDHSPLTEADTRAHDVILAALRATGLPVLSEEGVQVQSAVRRSWLTYWLVDPLDGTREFVKRNGEFTVNIALMHGSSDGPDGTGTARPIAGVLFAPATGMLYFAWQGGGAFRQHIGATTDGVSAYQRSLMSDRLPLVHHRTSYTILASRSHRDPRTDAFIRDAEAREGTVSISGMGSALKFGLMAEGAADVYPRFAPTMEWDTAAGQVICEEAGLHVIDLGTGASLRYNKHELVNGPFIVH
jgi:3'(2'), 5'-bisphosphate nucleotidase